MRQGSIHYAKLKAWEESTEGQEQEDSFDSVLMEAGIQDTFTTIRDELPDPVEVYRPVASEWENWFSEEVVEEVP